MGYERKIKRPAFGLALLTAAGTVHAQSAREPLVVTRLPETELRVIAMNDPDDDANQRFARAIDQAAVAQQQAIAERCKSARAVPAAGPARDAWEKNCRYLRR